MRLEAEGKKSEVGGQRSEDRRRRVDYGFGEGGGQRVDGSARRTDLSDNSGAADFANSVRNKSPA